MLSKTKIALVAALVLGIASAAQAGGRDEADSSGGYRVGPSGQGFDGGVNPVYHPSLFSQSGSKAFDSVNLNLQSRPHKKVNAR
jgi:hypothetical protein